MTQHTATPKFLRQLVTAQTNIKAIAYISIMGGTFTLCYMLLSAYQLGVAILNMAYVGYLAGGAVSFAIGIGLLTFSDAARAAGMVWFLAWGVVNLVVGATVSFNGDLLMGVFALTSGVVHLVFADLLHRPAEIFVTMVAGDLSPVAVQEGILKGQADSNAALRGFVKGAELVFENPPDSSAF